MMVGGSANECCQVYTSIRKSVLEYNLSRVGMEKLGMDSVQKMSWESLELRIKKWIMAVKVAVRVLYPSEKVLCNQVFNGLRQLAESSFLELSRGSVMQLMCFAEAITISRRCPEKLFKILDMYETLSDLLPAMHAVFSDELCLFIRDETRRTVMRLGEAARAIFVEFENAIQRESSKISVPGGAIHPLTRYVMNYIWLLYCYVGPLNRLLGEKKKEKPKLAELENQVSSYFHEDDGDNFADKLSPLGVQIVWLTVLLECNLDGKSKFYKEIALGYLFLMNNVHYIVQKVKKCELSSLVGKDWIEKQSNQVRQHATNYLRASWKKLLSFLQDEGFHVGGTFFSGGNSKNVLKDRLRCFNCLFEELHRTQSTWIVPDAELREELRISIEEKVIPAYRSFLTRHQSIINSGRGQHKYIKYTPEDLERCLRDLFEGNSFPVGTRRMSFSVS
ncbi:hypothetical protein KP509_01G111900 [Ceratopteris richardii]|nr:hypothetical protein KP509_01G111900 [Ceratopteris richardii]